MESGSAEEEGNADRAVVHRAVIEVAVLTYGAAVVRGVDSQRLLGLTGRNQRVQHLADVHVEHFT